ncbi:unnamed protein product [Cunninghamella blakesleeana]
MPFLILTSLFYFLIVILIKGILSFPNEPIFYNTIKLSTRYQLRKFIRTASTVKVHDKIIGFYVQYLIFDGGFSSLSVNTLTIYHVGKSVVGEYINFDHDSENSIDGYFFIVFIDDDYDGIYDSGDVDPDGFNSDDEIGYKNVVHFYSWLSTFPNLKKLSLQNQILADDDLVRFSEAVKQPQKKYYFLEELPITSSQIRFKNGLSSICQICPSLRILKLNEIDINGGKNSFNFNTNSIIINAPLLALDELLTQNAFVNSIGYDTDMKSVHLHVNQSVNGNVFIIKSPEKIKDKKKKNKRHNKKKSNKKNKDNKYDNGNDDEEEEDSNTVFKINLHCKSIDDINCIYDHYFEELSL